MTALIDAKKFYQALELVEKGDTITARRMELFLNRNKDAILAGETVLALTDRECEILAKDRES